MRFGSIAYLNLLPFRWHLRRLSLPASAKASLLYRRGTPATINRLMRYNKIDAAFVSSAVSYRMQCCDIGITAYGAVQSVLVFPDTVADDPASATSNLLAKHLGITGRVSIGDAALKEGLYRHDGIDLAAAWHDRYGLPFVFARLCYRRGGTMWCRLARSFLHTPPRIPHRYLSRAVAAKGLHTATVRRYLTRIHYPISWREKRALRLFRKKAHIR